MAPRPDGEPADHPPRSVQARVEVLPPPLRRPHTLPSGEVGYHGFSLRELRERFRGDEGEVVDPWGGHHRVSLSEWSSTDPDQTFLDISFEPSVELILEEELLTWHQVPQAAWLTPEQLVRGRVRTCARRNDQRGAWSHGAADALARSGAASFLLCMRWA